MAELDYAYLAEFAKVAEGKISAIGASFTHVRNCALGAQMPLSVAGRIRALEGEGSVPLRLQIIPPGQVYDIDVNGEVTPTPEARPYTREASEEVLVDLDEFNVVVGIEMLSIDGDIPFQRLIDDFHVHSSDVDLLRALRPSIGARLAQGADGVSSAARALTPVFA